MTERDKLLEELFNLVKDFNEEQIEELFDAIRNNDEFKELPLDIFSD